MKQHMKWGRTLLTAVIGCALMLAAVGCGSTKDQGAKDDATGDLQWEKAPEMAIDTAKTYQAEFHTSKGQFTIELFDDSAPITVNNFVFLSKQGYYEGVKFHRIIETFMIQTGDPTATGAGGPGYTIPDELDSPYEYEAGIVAMAKTTEPNSGGSQFFICTGDDAEVLNSYPDYTIFGRVTAGMDVVKEIAKTPVVRGYAGDSSPSKPTEDVVISKIEITEKQG